MLKITESEIIKFMQESAKGPFALRRLMSALGVKQKERREFKNLLQNLVDSDQLVSVEGGKYGFPRQVNVITGYVRANPAGFGFVIPDDENQSDLFIPPGMMKEVMDGDRVIARDDHVDREGRKAGTIVRILERVHKMVIGRYERSKHIAFVIPSNPFLTRDIIIPQGKGLKPKRGQLVVVQILEYPTKYRNPTGRVAEILGWSDDPNLDAEIVIRDSQLPGAFPEAVIEEARAYQEVSGGRWPERLDLRDLLTFTIDGENARDFDDAVSLQFLPGSSIRLWIHIADVSHYVQEGSALDEEAFSRGTSIYFPDRVIPMLPPELSDDLCSLKAGVDRLAFSLSLDFDADSQLIDYSLTPSIINSNERMTYTMVRDILTHQTAVPSEHVYLQPTLEAMGTLAAKLRAQRMMNGSIDFDLPEPEVILDLRGGVQSIIRAERNIAHNLIEEFMLTANQVVARHMEKLKIPFIYRVHDYPEEADILNFLEFLHGLGWESTSRGDAAKEKTKRAESTDRSRKKLEHTDLQGILNYFQGRPEEGVVSFLLLRTMRRARYSIQNVGHFGLALEQYTHFTSPIRRYPDLVVHRLLKKVLRGKTEELLQDKDLPEKLAVIANHSSMRERIAEEAERKIIDIKRTRYMQDKIGEEFTGIISGVTTFGFFVELEEIFVEGLVPIRNLSDDYYLFNERKHRLEGYQSKKVFCIGDRVRIRVAHVDLAKLHIDFTFVTKLHESSYE
ncbi:MAG: ribonuclease R [bacterium]